MIGTIISAVIVGLGTMVFRWWSAQKAQATHDQMLNTEAALSGQAEEVEAEAEMKTAEDAVKQRTTSNPADWKTE